MKYRLKKGDHVRVISGKDKGKDGKILSIDTKHMRVIVEGVNKQTLFQKPSANQAGGILVKDGPIHYSNVMLVDKNGKRTRIGYRTFEEGGEIKKIRIARTTGEQI